MKDLINLSIEDARSSDNAKYYKNTSGQALLIVLLTMSIVLTVVLSVVSRSITDISVTTYEEEAQRAFDAAEAGVERSLLAGTVAIPETSIGQAKYEVAVSDQTPVKDEYVYPTDIISGESATFWFVSHDDSGNLICDSGAGKPCFDGNQIRFCWGKPGAPGPVPAVELLLFYDDSGPPSKATSTPNDYLNVKVKRFAFDPEALARGNNFEDISGEGACTVSGQGFDYKSTEIKTNPLFPAASCSAEDCILAIKARMLYNTTPQPIGVLIPGSGDLPSQGTLIQSEGVSGESTRKVSVFQSFPELPFVFDATVFSPGGITKP